MNKGVPPARFGKSFDLPLSFHRSQFFHWPAAFYFILKNDAESSSFELLLDVFSNYFHKVIATATVRVDVVCIRISGALLPVNTVIAKRFCGFSKNFAAP